MSAFISTIATGPKCHVETEHNMKRIVFLATFVAILATSAICQTKIVYSVRDHVTLNEHRLLNEFVKLLSIPNVASDTANIRKNADYLVAEMQKRGLKPRLLEASDRAVPPDVYGEWMTPGATKTVIFYAHYDGQPTDPADWTGSKPWEPVLRNASLEKGGTNISFPRDGEKIDPEWRVYARSASDDKAGVFAILSAFESSSGG